MNLIIISAPSGAGKTALVGRLLHDPRYARAVTYTTRPPRPGERDGVDYHFVDVREFGSMIERCDFVEHAEVHGNLYGTSRAAIECEMALGRIVLLIIDWQGARSVREIYPGCTSVFILPPSMEELERRLRWREQDSDETIALRLKNAAEEMAHVGEFEHFIINDDLYAASQRIAGILMR